MLAKVGRVATQIEQDGKQCAACKSSKFEQNKTQSKGGKAI
jgi:hypothetical protein